MKPSYRATYIYFTLCVGIGTSSEYVERGNLLFFLSGSWLCCQHRAAAMWIQVRTMDGKETHRVDSLSKLTKVDELRLKIEELFKVEPERQRLFYRGKQVRCHL